MKQETGRITFVFFGSSRLSVIVLAELEKRGFKPSLIVTTPDKPQGRKLQVQPNVVKKWAQENNIRVESPAKLDAAFIETLKKESADIFIVASFGKILPTALINIPKYKTLNIHPSLLPKYRGASPLPTAILDDAKNTGVTIMRIDEEMDHGPIVAQKPVEIDEWPVYEDYEEMMAKEGANLLADILPDWVSGKIKEVEQDHREATYTRKYTKADGEIDLAHDARANFLKIEAFHEWPQAYFFVTHKNKKIRVKVTAASFANGKLIIEKVIPEGGKEMAYEDFARGYKIAA
jgi:methionyl-tRNA formyltransferase